MTALPQAELCAMVITITTQLRHDWLIPRLVTSSYVQILVPYHSEDVPLHAFTANTALAQSQGL